MYEILIPLVEPEMPICYPTMTVLRGCLTMLVGIKEGILPSVVVKMLYFCRFMDKTDIYIV